MANEVAGLSEGPERLLALARAGDAAAREALIRRYAPFAMRVASGVTGGYVEMGRDDEASVALMAFNEAIDSYDPSRGASFLGFVQAVVRRRLIDHYRKNRSRQREVSLSGLSDMESGDGLWADTGAGGGPSLQAAHLTAAEGAHRERETASERREEVLRYREMLSVFGISLSELVRICPRHEDARRHAVEAARALVSRPELVDSLHRRGELPLKELERLVGVSRKTLERQRKYIIALVLILTEDLPHLEAYLR